MRLVTYTFAALALAGCGGGADAAAACTEYLTVANACIGEAYGADASTYEVPTSTCDAYQDVKGDAAQTATDLFDCYVAAYDGLDCTDQTAVSGVGTEIAGCM